MCACKAGCCFFVLRLCSFERQSGTEYLFSSERFISVVCRDEPRTYSSMYFSDTRLAVVGVAEYVDIAIFNFSHEQFFLGEKNTNENQKQVEASL